MRSKSERMPFLDHWEHMIMRCNMRECVVDVFWRAWKGYVYVFERGVDTRGVRWEKEKAREMRERERERERDE
jgi:hypothetical protein